MDASASTYEVDEPMPSALTPCLDTLQSNALALEYLSDPSSSSIAMMRNAFKGLLDASDQSPLPISTEQEDFQGG
jgi:hypothetical protein